MRSLKDLQADFKSKDPPVDAGANSGYHPPVATGANSGYHAANSGYSTGRAQHVPNFHSNRSQWTHSKARYNEDWQWQNNRSVELLPNREAQGSKKSKAHSQRGEAVILKPREDDRWDGKIAENKDAGATLLRMLQGSADHAATRFPSQPQPQATPHEEPEMKEKWWLQSPGSSHTGAADIPELDDGRDCQALSIDALMAMRPPLRRDAPKPDCLPMTLALPRSEEAAKEEGEEEAHDAQDENAGMDKGSAAMSSDSQVFVVDEDSEAPSTLENSRGFGKWFGRRGNSGGSGDGDPVPAGTEANMSTDAGSGRDESSDGDGEGYGNFPTDWLTDAVPEIAAPIKN